MLWSRVVVLPVGARRLVEVAAVAGGPVPLSIAWPCLELTGDEREALAVLRSGKLVRTAGVEGEWIETYHDRIRETVVAHLPAEERRDCHRRLATALEAAGGADPEMLGRHFLEAGVPGRAAEYLARAAALSAEALAFDRAAALYRRASSCSDPGGAEGRRLRAALGEALANAGRGAEAAPRATSPPATGRPWPRRSSSADGRPCSS